MSGEERRLAELSARHTKEIAERIRAIRQRAGARKTLADVAKALRDDTKEEDHGH